MDTAVVAFLKIGIAAVAFILLGKLIFVGYHVPVLDRVFSGV